MAIAFRTGSNVSATGTSTTPAVTAGTRTAGDLLIVAVATDTDQAFTGKPTGWSYLPGCGGLTGLSRLYAFYRIATNTSADNFSGTITSDDWSVSMAGFSGVDQYAPFSYMDDATVFTASSSRANPFSSRSDADGAWLVDVWGMTGTSTGMTVSGVNSANWTLAQESTATSAVSAIWYDSATYATASPDSNLRNETFGTGGSMTGATRTVTLRAATVPATPFGAYYGGGNIAATTTGTISGLGNSVYNDGKGMMPGMRIWAIAHSATKDDNNITDIKLLSASGPSFTKLNDYPYSGTDNNSLNVWYYTISDEDTSSSTMPTTMGYFAQTSGVAGTCLFMPFFGQDYAGFGGSVRTPVQTDQTSNSTTPSGGTITAFNYDTVIAILGNGNKTSQSYTAPTGFTVWAQRGNSSVTTSYIGVAYKVDVSPSADLLAIGNWTTAVSDEAVAVSFAIPMADSISSQGGSPPPVVSATLFDPYYYT